MRRVLVTGGGTGIGQAIAQAFADGGDLVTITGRRVDVLEQTAAGRMDVAVADITDEAMVADLFKKPFDVVVANAGAGTAAPVATTSLDQWNATLSVNLTGTFLTFRAALDGLRSGSRLIAIASTASLQGGPNIAAYAAAKHGVLGLVRSLAKEIARTGATCNAICPGFVDTDMAETAIANVMSKMDVDRDRATQIITRGNPMGRLIDPTEVAAAALWLASPAASSVNGHALSVSGGEI